MIPLLAAVFVLLALCCAIGGLYLLSSGRGADEVFVLPWLPL